ncbi:hypothetical protein Bca4012_098492 [Brassica carinata]
MHAVIDRQKNHGMHFCVLAKALRRSGGDHIHTGTVIVHRFSCMYLLLNRDFCGVQSTAPWVQDRKEWIKWMH